MHGLHGLRRLRPSSRWQLWHATLAINLATLAINLATLAVTATATALAAADIAAAFANLWQPPGPRVSESGLFDDTGDDRVRLVVGRCDGHR